MTISAEAQAVPATLIIKQGACPAPVNPNSNGVLPMALISDMDFAADTAVEGSLQLSRCDGDAWVAPIANQIMVKDLNHVESAPAECGDCTCNADQSSDGLDDLSLKFSVDEMVDAGIIGAGDAQVTLELRGELADGTAFVARDCVLVLQPGQVTAASASFDSTVSGTYLELWPYDVNFDIDGFADFGRSYYAGTAVTVTAPWRSNGLRFLRWNVDGVMQPAGQRALQVTVTEGINVQAIYERLPAVGSDGSGPPAGLD
jgi:hypothetical protein